MVPYIEHPTLDLGFFTLKAFDVLFYYPEKLRDDPFVLLRFWSSFSSAGGMVGGIAGLVVVAWRRGLPRETVLRFLDCAIFAVPFTLAVGQLGCALQHDHLGGCVAPLVVAGLAAPRRRAV